MKLGTLCLLGALAPWLLPLSLFAQTSPTLQYVENLTRQMSVDADKAGRDLKLQEVVDRIGKEFPNLRSHFLLMHDSPSRQKASYEFPRVIAFAPDARFVMAFNGNPQAEGYYELEMFEFSADPKVPRTGQSLIALARNSAMLRDGYLSESFKFRRIIFKPAKDYRFYGEYRGETNFPAIKPINEQTCRGCHGESPRPNWESYNRWEGNFFIDDSHPRGRKYLIEDGPDHEGFDSFYTKQSSSNDRYVFLNGLAQQFLPSQNDYASPRVGPSQFTLVAGFLNYRRLAHLMVESLDFDTFKYAMVGALYDCRNFEAFIPDRIASTMAHPLDWYRTSTEKYFRSDVNYYFLKGKVDSIAKLRYLFEGRGLSMRKWSMSFRRSPFSFVTPRSELSGFLSALLIELDPSLEPARVYQLRGEEESAILADFSGSWNGSMQDMVASACSYLEKASKEAFADYLTNPRPK